MTAGLSSGFFYLLTMKNKNFNSKLIYKTKELFQARFGLALDDQKAEEYLLALCKFGLLLTSIKNFEKEQTDDNNPYHNAFSDTHAFAERSTEHRKAGGRKARGHGSCNTVPPKCNKKSITCKKEKSKW